MADNIFNCIICPRCCTITWDGSRCSGEGCKRGESFVAQELVSPRRTLTTAVKYTDGAMVTMIPVKSTEPVPLAEIADLVAKIRKVTLTARPEIGTEISMAGIHLVVSG